jgi:phosphopantetheinyl transferase (holo-ACP synthase)
MATDQAVTLRRAVAEFFAVEEGDVTPAFPLAGPRGASSITRAALDAAIRRRVGVKSRTVYTAKTFGELEAEIAPGAIPVPTPLPSSIPDAPAASTPLGCGVDMELVENLPRADDCWTDGFYLATFAPAEIAYCLVQPEPALHFVARWCAKEALRKCDPAFSTVELKDLEVAHEPAGAPYLVHHIGGSPRRLPHALSLSHTALAAVAVVVRAPVAMPSPLILPLPPPPAPVASRRGGWLALAALVIALWALYRTFVQRN